jgi:hypothetical protein
VPHIAVPFRSDMAAVVDGSGAGCPAGRCRSVRMSCRGRGCPQCRGVRAPGVRQAASDVRASGQPISVGCVDLAHVTSADEQAQRARRCRGVGRWLRSAAVLPRPAGQPDTAAGVWVAAEPDVADARGGLLLLSGTAVGVRTVGVRTVGVRRGRCRSLWVSAATGTGRPAGGWTGAATAGRRGRAGGRAGRRAGRARRSWPGAPRPGPPHRSARQAAGR